MPFYFGVRTSLKTLEVANLVAITDDTFIRAFVYRALDVPELHITFKELMTNSRDSCIKIFESIHADYISLNASSVLSDTKMSLTRNSHREEVKSGTEKSEVKGKEASPPRFLPNTANLMQQKVYSLMKVWFDEMSKPKGKSDPDFCKIFTFGAHKQKVKIVQVNKRSTKPNRS